MQIVDTHVHLFDPTSFPYSPSTIYTPDPSETATLFDLQREMAANGVTHAVLVGPMAGYQSDNACLEEGLRRGGATLRGIAIVESDVSNSELDRLGQAGVVGVRIDLIARGVSYLSGEGASLLSRLAERDWIVDLQCEKSQLAEVSGQLSASGARVVIDHMGRPDPQAGLDQQGFSALCRLADDGRAWIKLSGPFRFSTLSSPWPDAEPYARALIARYGASRLVWGSDWPFVRMPDRPGYSRTLKCLDDWDVSADLKRRILWDTPAQLFSWTS